MTDISLKNGHNINDSAFEKIGRTMDKPIFIPKKKEESIKKNFLIILIGLLLAVIIVTIITIIFVTNKDERRRAFKRNQVNSMILSPNHIEGIAGNNYTVNLSFSNKNECKKEINFSFNNSYNLTEKDLVINVEKNLTECNFIIYLVQYKMTLNNSENNLTIIYNGNEIKDKISLKIKNAEFDSLKWISGPTEGNVISPPIITFTPVDKYDNLYTDIFVNNISNYRNLNSYGNYKYESRKEFLESLTKGIISNPEVELEVNNYIEGNEFIKVQYK